MGQILIGIDTGGTYTDAVAIDASRLADGPGAVLASAKALTTRADLAQGIGAALDRVMQAAGVQAGQVALVSLSTTLATNALVEGQGAPAALVMIGFDPGDVAQQGLGAALGGDPVIHLPGGHDAGGAERAALDTAPLLAALPGLAVQGFAVCGHFAVRNPGHEVAVRDLLRARTGLPVTCSHELSARIGGPKRALTALLNARLIGMIDRLIGAAERLIAARGIAAPLMVVRGDGALVSAEFAKARPIETILSGPAASIVGAGWLTGLADAVLSDIGGTTTDIAVLRAGRPRIDPEGAAVGGLRTMVEAVAMHTQGLGGDSEVSLSATGLTALLCLGPRRLVPVSLLALTEPALVRDTLDRQLAQGRAGEADGRFLLRAGAAPVAPSAAEAAVLAAVGSGALPLDRVLTDRRRAGAVTSLLRGGTLMLAGFTPSDAAHVLGLHGDWDRTAAERAATLFARRRGNDGRLVAADAGALAQAVIDRLVRLSAEAVLSALLAEDGIAATAESALAAAALDAHAGLVTPRLRLNVPLIGLGASAPVYYPRIATLLGAEGVVPPLSGVANAVGAVVGRVSLRETGSLTVPAPGRFRAHLGDGPQDFSDAAAGLAALEADLRRRVAAAAEAAGAAETSLRAEVARQEVQIEGQTVLIGAEITVIATGRPRLADPVA